MPWVGLKKRFSGNPDVDLTFSIFDCRGCCSRLWLAWFSDEAEDLRNSLTLNSPIQKAKLVFGYTFKLRMKVVSHYQTWNSVLLQPSDFCHLPQAN
jgi:hypothetical protein